MTAQVTLVSSKNNLKIAVIILKNDGKLTIERGSQNLEDLILCKTMKGDR